MLPLINLLGELIQLYIYCVILWAIVMSLVSFKIINAYQPIVRKIMYALDRLVEPALRPIRKLLPDLGGLDISPILLILLLNFIRGELYTIFL